MVEEVNQDITNFENLQKGDIVKGKVEKIEEKQALINLGYKYDGILPIGEVSNIHIEKISDVLSDGDEIELKVIKVNDDEEKIILSKKVLDAEKGWEFIENAYEQNLTFEVKVADVVKGGLVVDVGVRGFIPASLVERHFVEDFSDYKGRNLKVRVIEIDKEKNKVILSQKLVLEEEEAKKKQTIIEQIKDGDIKEGTVQRLTDFGAFIDIGGIDGLVHVSEIDWERVEKPSDVLSVGDKVSVKVLRVDPVNQRISLSIKETKESPLVKAIQDLEVGEIYTGLVKRLTTFGAFIELKPGIEGLVHISQISTEHINKPSDVLKENQEVKVKILDINVEAGRIGLSIKEAEEQENYEQEKQKYQEESDFNITLGDVFGDKLKKLK